MTQTNWPKLFQPQRSYSRNSTNKKRITNQSSTVWVLEMQTICINPAGKARRRGREKNRIWITDIIHHRWEIDMLWCLLSLGLITPTWDEGLDFFSTIVWFVCLVTLAIKLQPYLQFPDAGWNFAFSSYKINFVINLDHLIIPTLK